jgi:peptide chain release factor 3
VSQVFRPLNGSNWIVGVVGPLQFDVLTSRIGAEYNVQAGFEAAPYETARWVNAPDKATLDRFTESRRNDLAEDGDGRLVFLARNSWELARTQQDFPEIRFTATREIADTSAG